MTTTNNKNMRWGSIAGLLLCIFYVLFTALTVTVASSLHWAYGGCEEYYISGWKSPNISRILFVTGIALFLVVPWICYFLNKRKTDYKPGVGYVVFTILLLIFHFLILIPIGDITTLCFGPKYIERPEVPDSIIFVLLLYLVGLIFYLPTMIGMLTEMRREKNNIARAEKIEE